MTIDLRNPSHRKDVVTRLHADIDAFCRKEFAEDPRTHLGASVIGDDCAAKGWNTFRWLRQEEFDGRMLRLFNRGHEEERRFVRWLQGAGFSVVEVDPDTSKQYRIRGVDGHFGGSLDSFVKAPADYGLPDNMVWLGEFKTHNDKKFKELQKKGVALAKPMHVKQMAAYGRAYGVEFGLYCAVNKNDDDLYFEIVELDYRLADDLFRKAEGIIYSRSQPQKISTSPAFFDCKYCDFSDICHKFELPTKNCRSCVNAVPAPDGQWHCELFGQLIPKDFIPKGCDHWKAIINGA